MMQVMTFAQVADSFDLVDSFHVNPGNRILSVGGQA